MRRRLCAERAGGRDAPPQIEHLLDEPLILGEQVGGAYARRAEVDGEVVATLVDGRLLLASEAGVGGERVALLRHFVNVLDVVAPDRLELDGMLEAEGGESVAVEHGRSSGDFWERRAGCGAALGARGVHRTEARERSVFSWNGGGGSGGFRS